MIHPCQGKHILRLYWFTLNHTPGPRRCRDVWQQPDSRPTVRRHPGMAPGMQMACAGGGLWPWRRRHSSPAWISGSSGLFWPTICLCDNFSGFYSLVPPFFSIRLPVDTADVSHCVNLHSWPRSAVCVPFAPAGAKSESPAPSPPGSIRVPGPSPACVPSAPAGAKPARVNPRPWAW